MKAVFANESLNNSDSLSSVVALMAEEDARSAVSGLTRVDWTTGEPREDPTGAIMRRDPVIDEVTAEPASGEASGATGEPSSGSGKNAVRKMPKRPAAKLMPRKKLLKVKGETASGTRQVVPGKNLFKNRDTKRHQKENKWIKIQKSAKEERTMPAPAYEIPSVGGTGPVKSFFDPASGHRETAEITPIGEEGGHRFGGTGSSFSRYPLENRTCYQCGQKGHLSANCPQKVRRVSLTKGIIKYEGSGETRPRVRLQSNMGSIPQHEPQDDDVKPEDSASQVGAQWTCASSQEIAFASTCAPAPLRGCLVCKDPDQGHCFKLCSLLRRHGPSCQRSFHRNLRQVEL